MSLMDDLGFDFFGTDDLVPTVAKKAVKKEDKKPKSEKKTEKKAEKKKNSNASSLKLVKPVTVYGRSFVHLIEGEGEISMQEVATAVVAAGYDEAKHQNVRFLKVHESMVILVYDTTLSDEMDMVSLPVTVCDGMKKAVYDALSSFGLDEDDDVTIKALSKLGLNDAVYADGKLDYDVTSGVALVVLERKDENLQIRTGDTIYVHGKAETVTDPEHVVEDFLGEVPENCKAQIEKGADGSYFLYLVPLDHKVRAGANCVSADRTAFGCKADKKQEQAKEKIVLPVEVYFANTGQTLHYEQDAFDGKKKIVWEDLQDKLKKDIPFLRSVDRTIDHWYDKANDRVAASFASGKKGVLWMR